MKREIMETKDKVQKVLDVIDGRAHPSTLVEILPKKDEEYDNFIRLAVDFLVAKSLERANAPASNYFRLRVFNNKDNFYDDWLPERSQLSAPMRVAEIRQLHPGAVVSVERSAYPEM